MVSRSLKMFCSFLSFKISVT
uniref:Uncharacterized protein n=1 Tax=Anguilla anguilla TaxID=7936 RepID=A0A0E9V0V6_ANGAN